MMFDKKLIDSIGTKLKKNNQSVAIAESVTSGLLQAAFSNADDASLFFRGGITAGYAAKMPEANVHQLFAYYAIVLNDKIIKAEK